MQPTIRHDKIVGSRRLSNYFWSFFLLLGGLEFLIAGISSYFSVNFLPFANTAELGFLPQGLVMIFYGTLSFSLSLYIILTIFLDVGSGYNEYDKCKNIIRIVRRGFPGRNRNILLTYQLSNVRTIGVKITEGLNPTRSIYLCLKDARNIPITAVQEPLSLSNLENEAIALADFLGLKLEIL
jgi:hypothetical protein